MAKPGLLVVFALLLSLSLALPAPAQTGLAQPPDPDRAAPRPLHTVAPLELRLPAAGAPDRDAVEPATPALAHPGAELTQWSRIVYQTARNEHDWEIFGINADGSGDANLTNNGAMDVHPRLNRGATRIAFASNREGNYEIFVMDASGGNVANLTHHAAYDTFPAWSPDGARIVFQSERDGQSEIYAMNADGSGLTRLTYHAEYDGEPAWSPDAAQIAFTRRNAGLYRIWVMNADGSNPHQLSEQPNSENPVWSPDGTQIAYDADGDADMWQEIWLMDAGGGNQQRAWGPGYATDAYVRSWSPDGRYVAFTEVAWTQIQGDWYWETAQLKAWDAAQPWTVLRLSPYDLDWEPDWQTTDAAAPQSNVTPLPVQSGSPFTVRWTGADVGASGLDTFDVQVRDGGGAWIDWVQETTTTEQSYPGAGGHTYAFRVRARDRAGNVAAWPVAPQAQTRVETFPPGSAIRPLPAFSLLGAHMTWEATDYGGSAIATLEVQYRAGLAGAWQPRAIPLEIGSAPIPGAAGETIYLRCRAIDAAGNAESWPAGDGDTHTTLYTGSARGAVRDHAGAPLVGVSVDLTPAPFAAVSAAPEGSYAAYTGAAAGPLRLAVSKAGYGSLPATTLAGWPDALFDVVLPPADNQVREAGFETPPLLAWVAGGSRPPVVSDAAAHSGQAGASLGWPNWPFSDKTILSTPTAYALTPSAAVDAAGRLHVVWMEGKPRYRQRTPTGAWLPPEVLGATADSYQPRLAVDQTGAAYVVWYENVSWQPDIFVQRRAPDGEWSARENVSNSPTGSFYPWLGVDAAGRVHVLWREYVGGTSQLYYAQRSPAGAWSTPGAVAPTAPGELEAAAVRANGEVVVFWSSGSLDVTAVRGLDGVWSEPQLAPEGEKRRLAVGPHDVFHLWWWDGDAVMYSYRPVGGLWSPPETAMTPRPGLSGGSADIAVDAGGIVHLAAGVSNNFQYARRSLTGAWSVAELIAATPTGGSAINLDLDAAGTLYAIWRAGYTGYLSRDLFFARRAPAGQWVVNQLAAGIDHIASTTPPALLLTSAAGQDTAHVVWPNVAAGGNYNILHAAYVPDPGGTAALRQEVTLPAQTAHPGLSFLYRLVQDDAASANPFEVTILHAGTTAIVFSTRTPTPEWTSRWVDLTPWLGESIEVNFEVRNAAGSAPALVYLDEVAVGSTYPDIWVTVTSSVAAAPGSTATITLRYGNRGRVAAQAGQVTLELPPELTFVQAAPAPTATAPGLTWAVGDLPAGASSGVITIQARVDEAVAPFVSFLAAATITSGSTEIEDANNAADDVIFAGHRSSLPAIYR